MLLLVDEKIIRIHTNNSPICNNKWLGIEIDPIGDKKEAANAVHIPQGGDVLHKEGKQYKKGSQVSKPLHIRDA